MFMSPRVDMCVHDDCSVFHHLDNCPVCAMLAMIDELELAYAIRTEEIVKEQQALGVETDKRLASEASVASLKETVIGLDRIVADQTHTLDIRDATIVSLEQIIHENHRPHITDIAN